MRWTLQHALRSTSGRATRATAVFSRMRLPWLDCLLWIIVEDEYVRDPAIRMPKSSIFLYPMTMISKRIERGEKVNVFDLFNSVAAQAEELQRQGK